MKKKLPVKVSFCGTCLEGIVQDGRAYVAMKPIVEGIGLDWKSQYEKITSDEVLSQVMVIIPMTSVGADGKTYRTKTVCLPEEFLQGWLFTISPSKVSPLLRDKIIQYKREAYRVLHEAFAQGVAQTNLRVMAIDSKRAAAKLMTDVTLDMLLIAGKRPKPYHFSNEHRLVNYVLTGHFEGVEEQSLTEPELRLLAALRQRNAALITRQMPYEGRKKALEGFAAEWRHDHLSVGVAA